MESKREKNAKINDFADHGNDILKHGCDIILSSLASTPFYLVPRGAGGPFKFVGARSGMWMGRCRSGSGSFVVLDSRGVRG